MARYEYTAYNSSGVRQKGVVEHPNEATARSALEADNLLIETLVEKQESRSIVLFSSAKLTLKDIEFITNELALLLESGMRVDKGLSILSQNVEKLVLRDFLNAVIGDLKQGIPLSQALSRSDAFSELYIGLVKIAEETGELVAVFKRLATEMKYQMDLRDKVRQALTYPAVILTVCIGALVFILNYVVPNMTTLFEGQEDLPGYTVALIATSDFVQNWQWQIVITLILLGLVLYYYRASTVVQDLMGGLREKAPLFASANLLVERIRFNAGLATMLSSGVAIDRALALALHTLRTPSLQQEVRLATEQVKRGQSLSQSLGETRLYPSFYAALLAIGEESGELARVFNEIAERSRRVFYTWVSRFTSLLEPLLILVMGAIVGSIVVVMMLSISAGTDVAI